MLTDRVARIHERIDGLLMLGRYQDLDELLSGLRMAELSADEMLAYLEATAALADRLAARERFFERVRHALASRGHLRGGTLAGLEGAYVGKSAPPAQTVAGALDRRASVGQREAGAF